MTTPIQHSNFVQHLLLLRVCLVRCLIVIGLLFLVFLYFAQELYHYIALPILSILPSGSSLIATNVISPLLVPLKFAFIFSCFCGMPYILFQLWQFIAPGLYSDEKYFAFTLLGLSTLLFYLGVAFAYFIVCPILFRFILNFAPVGIKVTPDIQFYLDFILRFLFAFGISFEVPVVMLLLQKIGISNYESLKQKRPYFIVIAFIIGMLLTPPDVLSQILLAIPLCLLFEIGLLLCRCFSREVLTA
ncbi:MAG: twin-arginine translocase subunit TatC [Legionellales bacterium]|nr:twin-arginine translocase subunit TatC [Legionellales bacterium]